MKTTKKKMAFTAFLTALISLGIFIPIFWFNNNASPLGTYIYVQFTCEQTGESIVGLDVYLYDSLGQGAGFSTTNKTGWVMFGSGLESGTYTIEWIWCDGPHSEKVTIDCSKQDWIYRYTVLNPEVHKTFLYDLPEEGAIEGLDVELVGYGIKTTNADGYVEWVVDWQFADTKLTWTWNGVPASESVLKADFVDCVWEDVNYLEPKSGGGKLHLPEESGY